MNSSRMAHLRSVLLVLVTACVLPGCGSEKKLSTQSAEALKQYTEGVAYLQNFYYGEARESFKRAIAADSTFAMAWMRLAMVNWDSRDNPEATSAMDKALHYARQAGRREQLFIRMWNCRLQYANREAAVVADSLIKLYPDEKEAYVFRGGLYELNKDFEAAVREYQMAIAIDTTYAPAVMSLGYAYLSIGDQEKALLQMQRYIGLAPGAADPRASYADLLLRVGRYDEALEQYRKSLELKPDYWYAHRESARVLMILGRLHAGEAEFQRYLDLMPPRKHYGAERLSMDGSLATLRGKYDAAIADYLAALAIDSTYGDAAFGLVNAFAKEKRFSDARDVRERIRQEFEHRNLIDTQVMLEFDLMTAQILTEEDSLQAALAACENALQYSSAVTRGGVYRQIAEIYLRLREFEPALDACEEALANNPNYPQALLTLTKVYHAKGDVRMTVEIGGRLLALWHDADPDFLSLTEVQRILGSKAGS